MAKKKEIKSNMSKKNVAKKSNEKTTTNISINNMKTIKKKSINKVVSNKKKKIPNNPLSSKQKKFAREWVKTRNGAQSVIKAGYSKTGASVTSNRLLSYPKVKEYIAELLKPIEEAERLEETNDIADIQEILQFQTNVMRGNVKDQFDLDAALKDRLDASKELGKVLSKTADSKTDVEDLKPLINLIKGVGSNSE